MTLFTIEYIYNFIFGPNHEKIKQLDIIFFSGPDCKYCKQVKEIFEKEGTLKDMTYVDVTTVEGNLIAKTYGVTKGVPTFVSKTLKIGILGSDNITSSNDLIYKFQK